MATHGHYWGFHSYWWPRWGNEDQHAWNYRRWDMFYKEMAQHTSLKPAGMITEVGVDGGVVGEHDRGWRDTGIKWLHHLKDMVYFQRDVEANQPQIRCAFFFCADTNSSRWRGFNLDYIEAKSLFDANAVITPSPAKPDKAVLKKWVDSAHDQVNYYLEQRDYTRAKEASIDLASALDILEDL